MIYLARCSCHTVRRSVGVRLPAEAIGLYRRILASDEDPTLTFPRNFAPLPLSRRSCGTFDPPAPAEAPSNCQDPAHTTAGWHTSRSAPHLHESGLNACAAQPNELQQRDQCRPVTILPGWLVQPARVESAFIAAPGHPIARPKAQRHKKLYGRPVDARRACRVVAEGHWRHDGEI